MKKITKKKDRCERQNEGCQPRPQSCKSVQANECVYREKQAQRSACERKLAKLRYQAISEETKQRRSEKTQIKQELCVTSQEQEKAARAARLKEEKDKIEKRYAEGKEKREKMYSSAQNLAKQEKARREARSATIKKRQEAWEQKRKGIGPQQEPEGKEETKSEHSPKGSLKIAGSPQGSPKKADSPKGLSPKADSPKGLSPKAASPKVTSPPLSVHSAEKSASPIPKPLPTIHEEKAKKSDVECECPPPSSTTSDTKKDKKEEKKGK